MIREYISDEQAEGILKIPICKSGERDRVVWPKSNNGTYMVKTGYMCLKKEEKKWWGKKGIWITLCKRECVENDLEAASYTKNKLFHLEGMW